MSLWWWWWCWWCWWWGRNYWRLELSTVSHARGLLIANCWFPSAVCPAGPWFVGEVLAGRIGACFLFGFVVNGTFVPTVLTYAYGAAQVDRLASSQKLLLPRSFCHWYCCRPCLEHLGCCNISNWNKSCITFWVPHRSVWWQPVRQRVQYKVTLLTRKDLPTATPAYTSVTCNRPRHRHCCHPMLDWLIDWLGFSSTFSTNRLYCAFNT